MQASLKKRTTNTEVLGAALENRSVSAKTENVVDDDELAASSTLSEKKSTARKMLLAVMALVC